MHDKIGATIASAKKLVGEQINHSPYKDILPTPKKENTAESKKSTREPLKITTEPKKSLGYQIKDSITGQLYKESPWSKSLYDKVDAYAIEKNIPAAQEAIDLNIKTGKLSKDDLPRYPYLRDGLAFSYAAGEVGNKKAEKAARELAYTRVGESEINTKLWTDANNNIKTDSLSKSTSSSTSNSQTKQIQSSQVNPKMNVAYNYQKNQTLNQKSKLIPAPENTTVYYGKLDFNNDNADLKYGDYNKEELTEVKGITKSDVEFYEKEHTQRLKNLAEATSSGDMQNVVYSMINHFIDGTGTDYQNEVLTEAVKQHSETQRYMNDFTKVFKEQLELNNGNISKFADSDDFHEALQAQDVYFSKYDYYGIDDIFGGLTMAVHSWTENEVKINDFKIADNGMYICLLEFTFSDVFGLDRQDVEKYWFMDGFKSWFILQHSDEYKEKYKPFKTVVKIYKTIYGTIKRYGENKNDYP